MLVQFDIPALAPDLIFRVRALSQQAEVQFRGGTDAVKRAWIEKQSRTLAESIPLPPKIPTWLAGPIRKAVISVIIDTVWALDREHST
jgi:hypothetical protein